MNKKTLHLLRQSPFIKNDIELCRTNLSPEDAIVLIDDGCYTLHHQIMKDLQLACNNIYIIEQHAIARGFNLKVDIQGINITQLNKLIFEYDNSVTWQ